ncbi:hypothetical protein [Massilia genomosp. 1]|uniref:Uncharacterized protein n=1 Tax=Massilia genomosp. 1 TaxID=2609280 RepID=A0ABX0MPV8_9BURK|nr:hypothetical protein [Massilia genomosp. 1]NHZ64802.1 hypothetical protein [Massilia genomosp. 1]
MIRSETAQAMVLRRSEGDPSSARYEKFAVQSCQLSRQGDYWVVCVNPAAYLLHGRAEHCLVGANAHLLDVISGQIETVASCRPVEDYLQDKYDVQGAAGMHYMLTPAFDRTDKAAVIRIRQACGCSMREAMKLASPEHHCWLAGPRRVLRWAQGELTLKNIVTDIILAPDAEDAVDIDDSIWHWDLLKARLALRIRAV